MIPLVLKAIPPVILEPLLMFKVFLSPEGIVPEKLIAFPLLEIVPELVILAAPTILIPTEFVPLTVIVPLLITDASAPPFVI